MDYKTEQWAAEEDLWNTFEPLISQGNWSEARALIESAGNEGYESLAIRMLHAYNKAWEEADVEYVPFEAKAPVMTAFEAHKWASPEEVGASHGNWYREGDEKYPNEPY